MENFDGLHWADAIAVNCFGVRIGIRTTEAGFARSLEHLLPRGYKATSSQRVEQLYSLVVGRPGARKNRQRLNVLYRGSERLAREREISPVLEILQTQIRRTVAETSPRRVFVHAGVVEWGGRAIVIPGRSMSGKSTLVVELIKLGATYYSDEYAVLDEKGFAHPFAKPLSLRKPGSFEAIDHEVAEFGGAEGSKPIPVGLVVVTRYVPGAPWCARELTRGQGLLALLSHAIAARRRPNQVMRTLRHAMAHAGTIKSIRGEASEAAEDLMARVEHYLARRRAYRRSDR
jgi:hypothetical protein